MSAALTPAREHGPAVVGALFSRARENKSGNRLSNAAGRRAGR
jgi:hypothetical protein